MKFGIIKMNLYQDLKNHKEKIIKKMVKYIKNNYANRTNDYYKCRRDLEYIYFAITDDLVNNNDDTTRRIASKFWHKEKRQISSYDVEFVVYDLLKDELKIILNKDRHNDLENLISKLKNIIKDGPDLSYAEDVLQNRRNVVKFNNVKVPLDLENILDNCIENTPVQNHTNFVFLKATARDQEIKDFLVKNFFYNNTYNKHMVAISTAPLVYIIQYSENITPEGNSINDNDKLQIGIHSGSLMQETLNFGYDYAFIGCGPDNELISDDILLEWKNIVKERWGINCNSNYKYAIPILCCCIGKSDFENVQENTYHLLSNNEKVKSQTFNLNYRKDRPKKLFT